MIALPQTYWTITAHLRTALAKRMKKMEELNDKFAVQTLTDLQSRLPGFDWVVLVVNSFG